MDIEKRLCPTCGYENPPEAKFCLNCGTQLVGGLIPQAKKPVAKPVLIEIKSEDRILLRALFLVSVTILLIDMLFNNVVRISMAGFILLGIIYVLGFSASLYALYIVYKKELLGFKDRLALLLSVIFNLLGTGIIYIISILSRVLIYSPIWIIFIIMFPIVWRIFKMYGA